MTDGHGDRGGSPRSGTGGVPGRPSFGSRCAAGGALLVLAATLVAVVVLLVHAALLFLALALVATVLAVSAAWVAATNRRFRWVSVPAAVVGLAGSIAALVAAGRGLVAIAALVAGGAVASALGTIALRTEVRRALADRWHPVPATRRGVVLMNPWSGGGKVEALHLADEARSRAIEPVVLARGDDLRELAEAAVARGADALGMAGGDGSQAVVASVAAQHGLPFVCIPAGTRNHLAFDLGIDRDDPVGALDAFGSARETSIDLAEVNGEVFVNNVSLGVYASVVASDEYRAAKQHTVAEMLPDLLGPGAAPSGLAVDSPEGRVVDPQIIQVSNNPYTISSLSGFGSRARLDSGVLGVATLSITSTVDLHRLVTLEVAGHPERFDGCHQWSADTLLVEGTARLAVAVDGEARTWEPPLHFTLRSGCLRVRIAPGQVGASAAFLHPPISVSSLVGLARVTAGRPSGIVPVAPGPAGDRRPGVG
jgi:diacylglycerol kinase family enzyme